MSRNKKNYRPRARGVNMIKNNKNYNQEQKEL